MGMCQRNFRRRFHSGRHIFQISLRLLGDNNVSWHFFTARTLVDDFFVAVGHLVLVSHRSMFLLSGFLDLFVDRIDKK